MNDENRTPDGQERTPLQKPPVPESPAPVSPIPVTPVAPTPVSPIPATPVAPTPVSPIPAAPTPATPAAPAAPATPAPAPGIPAQPEAAKSAPAMPELGADPANPNTVTPQPGDQTPPAMQVTPVPTRPQDQYIPPEKRPIPTIQPVPPSGYVPPNPERPRFTAPVERILALPPISRAQAEECRHQSEKPWYFGLIGINFCLIFFVIIAVLANMHSYGEKMAEISASSSAVIFGGDANRVLEEAAAQYPTELQLLFYGIGIFIAIFFSVYFMLAQVRSSSLKITPRNFPEIYAIAQSYAYRLGMERVPDIYVAQQNGVLNAFSSFIIHKQYIMINAEVFESAYREHRDIDSLAFILAHEMSHIYYEHATLHYNLWILFSGQIPIISQIASRTREYSCDRLAQMLTDYDGLDAMFLLIMDRHLYKRVDKIDYLENAVRERGFFLWLVNLLSSHPIMTKRIRALTVRSGSGELF